MDKLFIPRKNYMELDEVRNYLAIERWANRLKAGGGEGRDWGTVVVAAVDTHDGHNAHFTCDGNADQVEIQAALNSMPPAGGKLVLLEGHYSISGTINVSDNRHIQGMGPGTRVVRAPGFTGTMFQLSFDGDNVIVFSELLINNGPGTLPTSARAIRGRPIDESIMAVVDCVFISVIPVS
jgi:hypothetical protein